MVGTGTSAGTVSGARAIRLRTRFCAASSVIALPHGGAPASQGGEGRLESDVHCIGRRVGCPVPA